LQDQQVGAVEVVDLALHRVRNRPFGGSMTLLRLDVEALTIQARREVLRALAGIEAGAVEICDRNAPALGFQRRARHARQMSVEGLRLGMSQDDMGLHRAFPLGSGKRSIRPCPQG
jgi:hypothetical protein